MTNIQTLVKLKFYNADSRCRESIFTMAHFVTKISFEFIIRVLKPRRGDLTFHTLYCYWPKVNQAKMGQF